MDSHNFASFKAEILEMTAENVDLLHAMWLRIFDTKTCGEFLHRLKDHAQTFYTDLLNESREKQQTIIDEIAGLRAEARDLTRLLHESVDIGERPDDVPLVIWQLKLDKSIEHLREELGRRRAEICELLLQQEQLCEELGELPLPLLADPLPLPEEMDAFRDHLERLRTQRVLRLKEMDQLRQSIKHNMKLLECLPQTDQEERLLNQVDHCLTPETFERLRRMHKELSDQMQEMRERIDDMREKIRVLWERLQETDEYAMRRVREATEYTQYTYDVLREELQRCQALRRQNLKIFIEQLRVEINKWWDLTLKSPQERKRFSNYYNDWYNEDLLELHELELDDLKSFYENNKEIFDLYESRAELWARMEALEAKASEPNRFNNRGGQLLKEEKERKAITSKLPKIEQQITELVQAYEAKENTPFLVHGDNILERMAADWERHRQAKLLSSARKKAPTTASASKIMPPPAMGSTAPRTPRTLRNMSAMSSSTMSLRKTPSTQHLRPLNVTKSTGNLHKRLNPSGIVPPGPKTPNAKRSLIGSLNAVKGSPAVRSSSQRLLAVGQPHNQLKASKSPLKRVRVLETTLRRSGGMGRRSIGTRASKKPRTRTTEKENTQNGPDDYTTDDNSDQGVSYEEFQPPGRSSMLPRQRLQAPRMMRHAVATTMQRQLEEEEHQQEPRARNTPPSPRESLMVVQPRRQF
ncbi:protein regulator of cytokinesis 1 [Drosophila serrata]|uniref:protein regulator of cytokinesis 1 n=1 Tax=Drosophila serrata TaxID=7274 RepID=UPI000A1D219D|nr:protein regulator of cytokinesis 1 [Drosophila serrata]